MHKVFVACADNCKHISKCYRWTLYLLKVPLVLLLLLLFFSIRYFSNGATAVFIRIAQKPWKVMLNGLNGVLIRGIHGFHLSSTYFIRIIVLETKIMNTFNLPVRFIIERKELLLVESS